MRTTKTKVTFRDSFVLNRDVGELPAGSYNIEIDEEEILTSVQTGYRRTAIHFFVEKDGSTRMLSIPTFAQSRCLPRPSARAWMPCSCPCSRSSPPTLNPP